MRGVLALTALFIMGSCDDAAQAPQASAAHEELVTSRTFTAMEIHLHYAGGRRPTQSTVMRLSRRLELLRAGGYLDKPGGIDVALGVMIDAAGDAERVWTRAELLERLDAVAIPSRPAEGIVTVNVLYSDGRYEEDTGSGAVLGFATTGHRIVVLADNLRRDIDTSELVEMAAAVNPDAKDVMTALNETSIVMHELGHLFGLVNNGAPMVTDHQDAAHGDHDSDPACLMHYEHARTGLADLVALSVTGIDDAESVGFGPNCLADLAAVIAAQ